MEGICTLNSGILNGLLLLLLLLLFFLIVLFGKFVLHVGGTVNATVSHHRVERRHRAIINFMLIKMTFTVTKKERKERMLMFLNGSVM